jgi:hypothetical protein
MLIEFVLLFMQSFLDFEVDSDEKYEEEEPGENLEIDKEENTDMDPDEDDDGFFVPNRYLSQGEGCEDDEKPVASESCVTPGGEHVIDSCCSVQVTPERLKALQLAKAFE